MVTFTAIAETIHNVVSGLGVTVLLPIIIFVIAKAFRVSTSKAARSAVLIGVGFVGINLLLWSLFSAKIATVAQQMVEVTGVSLPAVDVGWPAAASIAWGVAEIGVWSIPAFVVINLVVFGLGLTYTLNVDIWNFWHFAFVGGLVYVMTGNLAYSFAIAMMMGLVTLLLADWTQPAVEETFDAPGISIPHAFSAPFAVMAIPINWILDRTPVGDMEADPEGIQDKLGVLGEPIFLGLVIGIAIGIGAYSNALLEAQSWYTILKTGMAFAGVMHILPMMVGILMEGLVPLSESIRDYMTSRYEDRDFSVGLDSAILIGHPSAIASTLILVPIAVVLMLILPGNDMLLGVDLAVFPFLFAMMVPVMGGNVIKMVIGGTIAMIPMFYIGTALADTFTATAVEAGFDIGEKGLVTSICDGSNPFTWLFARAMPWGLIIGIAMFVIVFIALRVKPKKMYMLGGASEEMAEDAVERRHG